MGSGPSAMSEEDTLPGAESFGTGSSPRPTGMPAGPAGLRPVGDLIATRITRAIEQRARYRYVRPHVVRDADGWTVVSPNCSRNIDPTGGEIDIARFLPLPGGRWRVHARDHAAGQWKVQGESCTFDEALAAVCTDPSRVFWP